MPFAIPTLPDLVERGRRAFRTHLPGSDAWLWPNNLGPTAKVLGGFTHEVFGFADYIAKSRFALTAPDGDSLDLHGDEFGLARQAAAPAAGKLSLVATTALEVAPGAVFRRADGIEYRARAGAALPGAGTVEVEVVSATNGRSTIALAGTALTVVSGVTGTLSAVTVAADGIAGGADVEDDESYRARILFRKRNPPHGGAASDYVLWAGAVPGVTRVFVERRYAGPGTVRVFALMDALYADGIAPAAEIARVQAAVDLEAPAGALVAVAAPAALPVAVTVAGLAPGTTAVQEAVLAELRDAFLRLSRVAGIDQAHAAMPYLASPFSFSRSWLWQAVANATGEERHAIAAPAADVAVAAGQMPVLGAVTFAA